MMSLSDFWNTNVYTAFRGIIMDYGLFGSIIFMLFFGIFSGCSYNVYRKNKTYGSLSILAMSYLFILYSFIISPYIYLNLTVFVPIIIILYTTAQKVKVL